VLLSKNHSSIRFGLSLAVFAVLMSGCSLILPAPDTPDPVVTPQLPPTPVPTAEPAPVEPVQLPEVIELIEPAPALPEPASTKVAIVLSGRVPAYENVAIELAGLLDDFEIYDLSDRSLTQKEAFDAIRDYGAQAVVAVGLRAAKFCQAITDLPVVFSQVFNVSENDLDGENFKGVAAIPPLAMQLEAWRQLSPELNSIGAIIGEGHDDLIDEAKLAADGNGLSLHHRIAKSDRETFYHFTRLAPDIDGFWLFPDNRILSASVLRTMLDYAAHHGVQVAVFSDSLLSLGAAISTTSVNADIAQTIVSVITSAVGGDMEEIPDLTPLSEIGVRTNSLASPQVAQESP
jgi:ABC-type uncharacterized transport system substrate-binding protein